MKFTNQRPIKYRDNNAMEHVIANPMNELAVRNAKYAAECTELHLANREISLLADRSVNDHNEFDRFVNLEVLWVNNNHLTRLDGLDMNFRIKHIYAQKNKIDSLKDSSIGIMTFLHTLNLADNKLSDLKLTLEVLQRQHHLKELNLNDNPIAEEKDFRLHVIKKLSWLEVLDSIKITDTERKRAERLTPLEDQLNLSSDILSASEGVNGIVIGATEDIEKNEFETNIKVKSETSIANIEGEEDGKEKEKREASCGVTFEETAAVTSSAPTTKTLLRTLMDSMRKKVKEKRICIKDHFLEFDRRGEESLRDNAVVEILHLYGLWPDEHGTTLAWLESDGNNETSLTPLQRSFLEKYAVPPPSRAKCGRDHAIVDGHLFINYVMLCRDLEPMFGGRDADDRERRAAEQWNDPLPEKTKVTLLLERDMRIYKSEMAAEEERLKLSMVSLTEPESKVSTSSFTANRHSDRNAPSLSPWEVHALWHFFETLDEKQAESFKQRGFKDSKPSGKLKRSDLIKGLDEMQYMGRVFSVPPQGMELSLDPVSMSPADRRQMLDKIFIAFETVEEAANAKEKAKHATLEPPVAAELETKPPAKMSKAEKLAAEKLAAEKESAPPTPVAPVVEGYSWRNFTKGVLNGIVDPDTQLSLLPPLSWSALPRELCLEKSSELFKAADLLQRRVLTGHESADDVRRIGEMVVHATRLEELAGETPVTPEESAEDDLVAAMTAAAKAAAASNVSNTKISSMGGLATVTEAVMKFKSSINHQDNDDVASSSASSSCSVESTVETKEARRLALLRRKFRLTQEQVEMMGKK